MVPSLNSIQELTIGDWNIVSGISLLLCCIGLFTVITHLKRNAFFCSAVLLVFIFELYRTGFSQCNIGLVIPLFLFVSFLNIDNSINVNRIFNCYYAAVILAAFFAFSQGIVGTYVRRTATLVDGSIAVIVVAILLFANNNNFQDKKKVYLRLSVIVSIILVIAFSMSRARLILVLGLLAVKMFLFRSSNKKGRSQSLLYIIIVVIFIYGLSQTGIGTALFGGMANRFDNGLESEGRNDEILFALTLFTSDPLWGSGWCDFFFRDYLGQEVGYNQHSMYVALIARGGIVFASVVIVSLYKILKESIKVYKIDKLPCVLTVLFLFLAYGNAGFFNYTICGFFIPIIALLKQYSSNGINVYHQ